MGKVKKTSLGKQRHDPLHVQISKDTNVAYNVKNRREKKTHKKESEEKQFIDPKTSKRILSLVREQQEEIAKEENNIKLNIIFILNNIIVLKMKNYQTIGRIVIMKNQ